MKAHIQVMIWLHHSGKTPEPSKRESTYARFWHKQTGFREKYFFGCGHMDAKPIKANGKRCFVCFSVRHMAEQSFCHIGMDCLSTQSLDSNHTVCVRLAVISPISKPITLLREAESRYKNYKALF